VQLFALIPFQAPLYYSHHVLFVEFDAAGVLHDIELVDGENACSKDDVCVKHWDLSFNTGGGLVASDETTARLDESVSIITASHSEDQRARHFRPNNNSCGFYLLANELIEDRVGIDGNLLLFSIDGYKDKPLDEDTYVFQELTPGTKALLLSLSPPSPSNLERLVHKEFECHPGNIIYVVASVKLHFSSGKFDLLWTVDLVTPTEWWERIKDKKLQLLDNPSTGEPHKTVQERMDQLKQAARSQRQKEEVMRHFALDPSTKPIPTSEEDKRAKTLRPKQGEALIYFYQDKGTDAEKCAQPLILYSGQNPIGRSTTNGYSIAFVSAGLFEYMLKQTPWKRVTLEDLGTYYLRARWTYKKRSSGGGCSVNIEMVPDDEGMASLKERSVVDIMRYHNNEIFIIR